VRAVKRLILALCTFVPSPVRLLVWRLLGMEVGPGCRVGMGSLVIADKIKLGPGVVIEPLALIYCPAYLELGERCRVSYFVQILGSGRLVMGPQSYVITGAQIDTTYGCRVGARSAVGTRCVLMTHGDSQLTYRLGYTFRNGPVEIGADCYLGFGVNVYPNVKVGDRSVIAPGVVVAGDVEADQLVLPPQLTNRMRQTISVGLLRARDPRQARAEKLESDFRALAELAPGSSLDDSWPDYWVLTLPRRKRVVLVRDGGADVTALLSGATVVWTAVRDRDYPVPTFDFSCLTVHGRRTALAERIAAFLCASRAVHFAFAPPAAGPDRRSAA
jgi:acetyltransferase-like isoleucine patch superfamily enzyme